MLSAQGSRYLNYATVAIARHILLVSSLQTKRLNFKVSSIVAWRLTALCHRHVA